MYGTAQAIGPLFQNRPRGTKDRFALRAVGIGGPIPRSNPLPAGAEEFPARDVRFAGE